MFTELHATISQLSHLKYLDLRNCDRLKELTELPPLVQNLKAGGCTSLENIGDLSNAYKWLFKISFSGCHKLLTDGESQSHIANMTMKSLVEKCVVVNHRLSIMVPGSKIPNWFSDQRLGNKIELCLPHNQVSKMIGLAICCRLPSKRMSSTLGIRFELLGEGNLIVNPTPPGIKVDSMWVGYMPIDILGNLCHGFEYENLIIRFEDYYVVECGVCVVYKDDIQPMIGTKSWISDYDELGKIDHSNVTSEELQHERWSFPTFAFNYWKTGDNNLVEVGI